VSSIDKKLPEYFFLGSETSKLSPPKTEEAKELSAPEEKKENNKSNRRSFHSNLITPSRRQSLGIDCWHSRRQDMQMGICEYLGHPRLVN